MEKILLTGASGNVGKAVLEHFKSTKDQQLIVASRTKVSEPGSSLYFDFEDLAGTRGTLRQIDTLFLLRPPHISDVATYFEPLIKMAVTERVEHVVFLSVQGAENISFIPHAKIEKLLRESGIPYTFLRPSYFMQNLTTTLLQDIRENNRIFLPAGRTPFLWVDVADIGRAVAAVLRDVRLHQNKAYTITGSELFTFHEVAELLSNSLGREVEYISPSLISFFFQKLKEGVPTPYILVMIMLHYLPRFQKPPKISQDFTLLTYQKPTTLEEFIDKHVALWK